MASVLLNYGYELAFTSGILENIYHEGQIGKFEDSNYQNKSKLPSYLKYMNDNYNYHKKYAKKFIFDFSLFEIKTLLEELEKKNFTGKFGLGCVQWTGDRTLNLVNYYLKETGDKEYITFEKACAAESKLIIYELVNIKIYNNIYSNKKKLIQMLTQKMRLIMLQLYLNKNMKKHLKKMIMKGEIWLN